MHVHAPPANERTRRILKFSLAVTSAYIVLTVVAGVRAHSLALISEAGHNVSDFLALLLSWVAVYVQVRPPTSRKTFGYQRAGVLAAFVNSLSLIALSFYLMYEAGHRLYAPQPVEPNVMMLVAGVGVVMNAGIAWALFRASRDV